jgi:hypothetical protein
LNWRSSLRLSWWSWGVWEEALSLRHCMGGTRSWAPPHPLSFLVSTEFIQTSRGYSKVLFFLLYPLVWLQATLLCLFVGFLPLDYRTQQPPSLLSSLCQLLVLPGSQEKPPSPPSSLF